MKNIFKKRESKKVKIQQLQTDLENLRSVERLADNLCK